jgi:hypothetical protein
MPLMTNSRRINSVLLVVTTQATADAPSFPTDALAMPVA